MIFTKYSFPLPNNDNKYDLSQDKLVELLDNTYNYGFEHARDIYDSTRQTITTISDSLKRKRCKYHCDYGDGKYCHYKGKKDCVNF